MNSVFTFLLGLLIGWVIEWLIDFAYWRRRYAEKVEQYSGDADYASRTSSPNNYDLFKTLASTLFVIILVLMLVAGFATDSISLSPAQSRFARNPTSPLPTQTSLAVNSTDSPDSSPVPATVESTTATIAPTPTLAFVVTEESILVPGQATPSQVETPTCNTSLPSRLRVGQTARVVQSLRMRTVASIDASLIQINPPNTQVEIIGGPVCTAVGDRSYLWWQIRLADGTEGWSVESQLNEASYFLEPLPQ